MAHLWQWPAAREESPPFMGHDGIVNSVALTSGGDWLVTASDDLTARVWEVTTRAQVAVLDGHAARVVTARFGAGPVPRVITASEDGTARVYVCEVCASIAQVRQLAEQRLRRDLTFAAPGRAP
jgi:WD40 repeat protein